MACFPMTPPPAIFWLCELDPRTWRDASQTPEGRARAATALKAAHRQQIMSSCGLHEGRLRLRCRPRPRRPRFPRRREVEL